MNIDPEGLVQAWMTAFEVPNDLVLQEKLIIEECIELLEAITMLREPSPTFCADVLKEYADVVFVLAGFSIMKENLGAWDFEPSVQGKYLSVAALDIIGDIVAQMPEFDTWAEETFGRVCASNMTKLADDGRPVRNEAGKVMKGANYKAPDLTDLGLKFYSALKAVDDKAAAEKDQMVLAESRVA